MPPKRTASTTAPQAAKKAKATDDAKPAKKAPKERTVFERDDTPRQIAIDLVDEKHLKAMTWNVAGLRPLLNNAPEVLRGVVDKEKPDLLCLIETKLQESHKEEFDAKLEQLLPQYSRICQCNLLPERCKAD